MLLTLHDLLDISTSQDAARKCGVGRGGRSYITNHIEAFRGARYKLGDVGSFPSPCCEAMVDVVAEKRNWATQAASMSPR